MAKSIKALLNKKGWTGKEVGKALLMNLKNDIENKGNPDKKPLFSQEDYNRMVDSLDTDYQYTQYKVLESIYSAIVDSFNYNEAMAQQFYNGYYRYFLAIREAQRAEDFFTTTEKFPLILTQAQYDRLAAEREAYKRGFTESYYSLFFHTVAAFVDAVENDRADSVPEDILAAITATQSQKVTNKRILANWAEDMGEGYYTLPDGRRSDNMTAEEWQAALTALFMESHKLYINGELQDAHTTAQHFNTERLLTAYRLLFKGEDAIREAYRERTGQELPEEYIGELEKALEEIIDETASPSRRGDPKREQLTAALFYNNGNKSPEWHYYTEPPTDFTKYDVLADMLDRYRGAYSDRLLESGGEYVDEVPEREQLKEFKKDYPALADAVKTYLEGTVAPTKGLKANQLYKDLITWGELADMGYLDYQSLIAVDDADIVEHIAQTQEDNTENFNRRARGIYHGIAILKEAKYFDAGEGGEYIDPVADKLKLELLQGIDYLESNTGEAEYIAANLDFLALPALRYMYAYNAFIEIVAAAYDIDFMTVAKYDLSKFESQIEACNNMLYMLYKGVYGTADDKKRKRAFIREYFQPIEIEDLKPTEEAKEALRAKIEGLGYTREAAVTLKNYRSLIAEIMREGAVDNE
mgnify:CR=1 FL=1